MASESSRARRGAGSIGEALLGALSDRDRASRNRAVGQAARLLDPDQLVEAVADGSDSLRRNAAITALTRAGGRSVPALIRALRHEDLEVVMFAATILGKTRDVSAVPDLVELVAHRDINVAQAAIVSLGQLRSAEAVDALVAALDRDPWLKFAAAYALGDIGDPRGADALLPLLDDESIRPIAIEALGKISSPRSLAGLARLLRAASTPDSFIVCLRALAGVLYHQPDEDALRSLPVWRELADIDTADLHLGLLQVLSSDQEGWEADLEVKRAAATLIRLLRMSSLYTPLLLAGRDPELQEVVRFSVIAIGHDMASSLSLGMGYQDPRIRALACFSVGAIRLHELTARVERLLADPDEEVREAAVATLARLGSESCVGALVAALGDEAPQVCEAARSALARLDAERVTAALSKSAPVAPAALIAALEIASVNPHERQRAFIQPHLADPDEAVREAATLAMAAQPGDDCVDLIAPLLADPSVAVRGRAVDALGRRRLGRARDLLLAHLTCDPELRVRTVRALAELDDASVVPRLLEAFDSEQAPAQLAIIEALAELHDPAAEPFLVRLLAAGDSEIRRTAVRALARFGSSTALRHLTAVARDESWEVRATLAEALAELDDPASIPALERLCVDDNDLVASIARRRLEALDV